MTLFSGAEKWILCFLSGGTCFFLVFSESHLFPVSLWSPSLSHSKPCTIRGSYSCFCLSPTSSLRVSPCTYTETRCPLCHLPSPSVWGRVLKDSGSFFSHTCPRSLAISQASSCSSASPGLPSPLLPSRSLEQLFPPGSASWGAVHIPSHRVCVDLAALAHSVSFYL